MDADQVTEYQNSELLVAKGRIEVTCSECSSMAGQIDFELGARIEIETQGVITPDFLVAHVQDLKFVTTVAEIF